MKQFNLFLCLLILFVVVAARAYASVPGQAILWELESTNLDYYYDNDISRSDRIAALEKPRKLILLQETLASSGYDEKQNGRSLATGNARIWVRNPNGEISEVTLSREKRSEPIALNLPSDLNAGEVTGNYLVGVHLDAGTLDLDLDGIDEKVHLYSNCLVSYSKKNGVKGENPDMFFKSPDKITLEIGPYLPEKIFKKRSGCPIPRSIRSGSDIGYVRNVSQSPLKEQQMKVFYKGSPLANTQVFILSKSGWRKTFMTDSEGVISVTIPKTHATMMDPAQFRNHKKKISIDRSGGEQGNTKQFYNREPKAGDNGKTYHGRYRAEDRLLYMVAYKDPSTGEYHCATLPITLRMWSHEGIWLSQTKGFGFWGIIGASLGVVGVSGGYYRKRKRDRESIFKSKRK
ncbi:hypothetical protein [Desulfosarcina ovata]|uniref:Uncharacterized protein n=1 Tax=Desulfosarcina ovata subsp. ovata TaxID=2752305 RepID=A0A5K8A9F1_9BACT|nr:hypothetical protein [Desulfosarcina ovata]BBO89177.1 hypothetical protein DSCOOX_23570 [Desulfosarcina ovata subsp. ovata]